VVKNLSVKVIWDAGSLNLALNLSDSGHRHEGTSTIWCKKKPDLQYVGLRGVQFWSADPEGIGDKTFLGCATSE